MSQRQHTWVAMMPMLPVGAAAAVGTCLAVNLARKYLLRDDADLSPLEAWVAKYDEDAVDPDLPILDAHHHLILLGNLRTNKGLQVVKYLKPWLVEKLMQTHTLRYTFGQKSPLVGRYPIRRYASDIAARGRGHRVVGSVAIECLFEDADAKPSMKHVGEADWHAEQHKLHPALVQAFVGRVDLTLDDAGDALKHYARNPLVKGIRHSVAWDADPRVFSAARTAGETRSPDFRRGFGLLAKYGFSFDTWCYGDQLQDLVDLSSAFPETTIVVDHMGMPFLGGFAGRNHETSLGAWKDGMRALAEHPNVVAKIGGMGMRPWGFRFDERAEPPTSDELAEAWGPCVRFVVDAFGTDRCIMESNFPMDKISCSYTVLFNALKKTVLNYPREARAKMFEGNARRVYRI